MSYLTAKNNQKLRLANKSMQEPSSAKRTYLITHINNSAVHKIFLHTFQYSKYFQMLPHLDKVSNHIKLRNYCRKSSAMCMSGCM